LQNLTLALLILGGGAAELSFWGQSTSWLAVLLSLGLAAALLVGHAYWRRCREGGLCRRHGLPVVIGFVAVLAAVEAIRFSLLAEGLPNELLLFVVWRDSGLLLGLFLFVPLLLRIAGAVSASWVLVASCLADGPLMFVLLLAYATVGSLWLGGLYWNLVQQDLVAGSSGRIRIPALAWVWCAVLVLAILVGVGPKRAAWVLAELLPTSGGTQQYDPRSRGGVNDGDEVTAARDQARSTGAVDSNIFFDSEERSFYDAAQDIYGEPRKPRDYTQAIAIEAERMRHDHNLAEQQQARREFALTRRHKTPLRRPEDRLSDALFHVEGPGPIHVRMLAYDSCDGVNLIESPQPLQRPELTRRWGGWLSLEQVQTPAIYGARVEHTFRINRLQARQIPLPPHWDRLAIGRVDEPRFFCWTQPGILGLTEGLVPRNTVVRSRSRTVAPERLLRLSFPRSPGYALPRYYAVPDAVAKDPRFTQLAQEWTRDVPRGWAQVAAVQERLRSEYRHVRQATVPEDRDDPLAWFLFDAKAGPDFLFACSASALLRCLGYPTRVVGGFYVAPREGEPPGQMSVHADDMHFWCEVYVPGEEWVVVEATPGYTTLSARFELWAVLYSAATASVGWLRDHPLESGGVVLLAGLAVVWRRRLLAGWHWLRWRLACRGSWRRCVLATLRLVEARAKLAGWARPAAWTPWRWYQRHLQPLLPEAADFFRWCQHAAYDLSPQLAAEAQEEALQACRMVVQRCRFPRRNGSPSAGDARANGQSRAAPQPHADRVPV
jgi:transglutaminase-like putative cysteine protease